MATQMKSEATTFEQIYTKAYLYHRNTLYAVDEGLLVLSQSGYLFEGLRCSFSGNFRVRPKHSPLSLTIPFSDTSQKVIFSSLNLVLYRGEIAHLLKNVKFSKRAEELEIRPPLIFNSGSVIFSFIQVVIEFPLTGVILFFMVQPFAPKILIALCVSVLLSYQVWRLSKLNSAVRASKELLVDADWIVVKDTLSTGSLQQPVSSSLESSEIGLQTPC
jgi:hypothetical protein